MRNPFPNQKPIRGALINRSHPLARNLVAAYPLNEGSGKTIHNYANDPRFPDLTLTAEKWEGSGLLFETGNTDYADADMADFPIHPLSIFAKVRFHAVTTVSDMTIAGISDKSALGSYSSIRIDYNTQHNFEAYSTFFAAANGPDFTMAVGDVYTVLALFVADDDRRIYVNGGNLGTDTNTGPSPTIDKVTIGAQWYAFGGDPSIVTLLEGTFVECVYFWDRVLSGAEAKWLNQNPYAMFYPAERKQAAKSFHIINPFYPRPKTTGVIKGAGPTWQKPIRGTLIDNTHPITKDLVVASPFNEGTGENAWSYVYPPNEENENHKWRLDEGDIYWTPFGLEVHTGILGYGDPYISLDSAKTPLDPWTLFAKIKLHELHFNMKESIIAMNRYENEYLAIVLSDPGGEGAYEIQASAKNGFETYASSGALAFSEGDILTVCGVFASSALRKIYVNGLLKDTDTTSCSISAIGGVDIGVTWEMQGGNTDMQWDGEVACAYVWNRVLSDEEVMWMHRNPYGLFTRSRKYYREPKHYLVSR